MTSSTGTGLAAYLARRLSDLSARGAVPGITENGIATFTPNKVLVVEDEPVTRSALRQYFSLCGCEVSTAASAPEAVDEARSLRPDVLVTDWQLEGESDGVALARKLRAANRRLAVIVITGQPLASLKAACTDLKVQRIVAKPVSLREIAAIVSRYCRVPMLPHLR